LLYSKITDSARLASNKKQWCEIMRIRIIESFWFVEIEKNLKNKKCHF